MYGMGNDMVVGYKGALGMGWHELGTGLAFERRVRLKGGERGRGGSAPVMRMGGVGGDEDLWGSEGWEIGREGERRRDGGLAYCV